MDNNKSVFLFIILVVGVIAFFWIRSKLYHIEHDSVIAFTGGLGSGKSFLSTDFSIKLYKKNLRKVKFSNLFKVNKQPLPKLYSNIPICVKGKEFSNVLTNDILLLQSSIPPKSVVFIDEVDSFASQYDFKNPNCLVSFDEFVRLFRHYTKGGFLVVNTQCSENIILTIRRRINTIYNLMNFRSFFIFYWVKIRSINISEEIKTIEDEQKESSFNYKIGLLPLSRHYDTYCYSERYKSVPSTIPIKHNQLKTNTLLKVPSQLFSPKTDNTPLSLLAKKKLIKKSK